MYVPFRNRASANSLSVFFADNSALLPGAVKAMRRGALNLPVYSLEF
jgi:hypothetical protein